MPPKATVVGDKSFPQSVVVTLVAQLVKNGGKPDYNLMSGYDAHKGGDTTQSGYEHQFRVVLAEAKELVKSLDKGVTYAPVPPKARGTATSPSKKRHGPPTGTDDEDDEPTPKPAKVTKKRAIKKQKVKKEPVDETEEDVEQQVALSPVDDDTFVDFALCSSDTGIAHNSTESVEPAQAYDDDATGIHTYGTWYYDASVELGGIHLELFPSV
ncbi:hypothetical protein NA57DRAFT_74885 [Rhizodiscina lignyota]|uniref:Uncharacterized protein n=1 Tax=Rhizodiscina lignyota TaxID=1504668 RepID=A0A9P4MB52_9PEZI|nr:hypothetical protein NA57DRAFT_74885 [Rhizodiscina lignyota]